uniref:Ig-like domain-containing protein n=1 Tax=Podarcis muralis TaxID=64176 RepID=A0A670JBL0_PODMU
KLFLEPLTPNKNLKPGDLVTVICHTFSGYPEATVLWQDGRGNNITENITTSQVANEEGLFDVRSILRVVLEPNSTYSCLVRNPLLLQETHASVTITGQGWEQGREGGWGLVHHVFTAMHSSFLFFSIWKTTIKSTVLLIRFSFIFITP